MPYRGVRGDEEQHLHDEFIRLIAKVRYNYDDKVTYVNPGGEQNRSAGVVGGMEQYPDIVVIEKSTRKPSIIVEIETDSSVKDDEVQQWMDFASLNLTFFLYVPKMKVDDAINIINPRGLRRAISGLRGYDMERGQFKIKSIW